MKSKENKNLQEQLMIVIKKAVMTGATPRDVLGALELVKHTVIQNIQLKEA